MNSESKGLDDPTAEDQVESAWLSLIGEALAPHDLNAGEAAGVRSRLLRRAAASVRRHAGLITIRRGDGAWRTLKAGVRVKLLCEGAQGASVLIELSPGASLPAHRHQHLEEGIVLRGELRLGDLHLGPGDYHVSPSGSRHGRISSAAGGLAYLRGSSLGHTSQVLDEPALRLTMGVADVARVERSERPARGPCRGGRACPKRCVRSSDAVRAILSPAPRASARANK